MISQSVLEVVVRAFAAQKDTLTPLLVSFFTTVLNILLAIWLSRPLTDGGLEHGGLALANGVAVGVESLIGLTILHLRWRGVDARRILIDSGKAALAALVMGGVILAIDAIFNPGRLILLLVGGALGGLIYFALALLLGIEEIRTLPLALFRYVRRDEITQ
jgi:putative peptidoglycan lipid II flippase